MSSVTTAMQALDKLQNKIKIGETITKDLQKALSNTANFKETLINTFKGAFNGVIGTFSTFSKTLSGLGTGAGLAFGGAVVVGAAAILAKLGSIVQAKAAKARQAVISQ
jgi:hypothetical protein